MFVCVNRHTDLQAKSYDFLDNDWQAKIGYSDVPAFVVPPSMVMPPLQFSLDRNQNATPSLFLRRYCGTHLVLPVQLCARYSSKDLENQFQWQDRR